MKLTNAVMWNLNKFAWIAVFGTAGLIVGTLQCSAQSAPSSQTPPAKSTDAKSRLQSHDSVTVTAEYTPEEKEDQKINEVWQPIYWLEQKGDCEAVIERYKTELIPLAEQSKFERPKKKFLSMANEGIGHCYMTQGRYAEAEERFRQNVDYLVKDDSSYPINFRELASAQMGEQHWNAAEESLKKSVSLFDPQIEKGLTSKNEFVRTEHVGLLYGGKARSLGYLAVVYLREGQTVEALKTADSAYHEATQPNVPSTFATDIVKVGRLIAQATGDEDAMEKWSQRKPPDN